MELKIEIDNCNIELGGSHITLEGEKIISFDKKYDSLSNEHKKKLLEFTLDGLSIWLDNVKEKIELENFKSKFNFEEELELVKNEVNNYLLGNKFKKEEYLRGFIHTYYHTKRDYNLHWSVGDIIFSLIKNECCEEI